MRNFLKDERGAIAILMAISMVPLIGAIALCIECGLWALTRAKLQGAADAAAISAVLSGDEDYADVARAMASANGFDDGVTVTREACPSFASGDCVHVTISHDVPLIFAPVVGYRGTDGSGSQRITAEAVAAPGGSEVCVLAMHDLTGRGSGDLRGCSTMANDTAACDSSMAISTSYANGSNSGCGARRVAQPLLADPYLGAITIPSHTCGSGGSGGGGGGAPSQLPGRVSGTVSLSAGSGGNWLCGDQVLTGNVVFTSPLGQSAVLYIKDGGLKLNNFSASSAFGSSVTLVFTGTAALQGHAPVGPGSLELSAPTTGPWAGIALAIDPNSAQADFTISNWRTTGIIYASRSTVTWSGTIDPATKNCVVIVARDLVVDGGRLGAANSECGPAGVVQPRTNGSNARLIQ